MYALLLALQRRAIIRGQAQELVITPRGTSRDEELQHKRVPLGAGGCEALSLGLGASPPHDYTRLKPRSKSSRVRQATAAIESGLAREALRTPDIIGWESADEEDAEAGEKAPRVQAEFRRTERPGIAHAPSVRQRVVSARGRHRRNHARIGRARPPPAAPPPRPSMHMVPTGRKWKDEAVPPGHWCTAMSHPTAAQADRSQELPASAVGARASEVGATIRSPSAPKAEVTKRPRKPRTRKIDRPSGARGAPPHAVMVNGSKPGRSVPLTGHGNGATGGDAAADSGPGTGDRTLELLGMLAKAPSPTDAAQTVPRLRLQQLSGPPRDGGPESETILWPSSTGRVPRRWPRSGEGRNDFDKLGANSTDISERSRPTAKSARAKLARPSGGERSIVYAPPVFETQRVVHRALDSSTARPSGRNAAVVGESLPMQRVVSVDAAPADRRASRQRKQNAKRSGSSPRRVRPATSDTVQASSAPKSRKRPGSGTIGASLDRADPMLRPWGDGGGDDGSLEVGAAFSGLRVDMREHRRAGGRGEHPPAGSKEDGREGPAPPPPTEPVKPSATSTAAPPTSYPPSAPCDQTSAAPKETGQRGGIEHPPAPSSTSAAKALSSTSTPQFAQRVACQGARVAAEWTTSAADATEWAPVTCQRIQPALSPRAILPSAVERGPPKGAASPLVVLDDEPASEAKEPATSSALRADLAVRAIAHPKRPLLSTVDLNATVLTTPTATEAMDRTERQFEEGDLVYAPPCAEGRMHHGLQGAGRDTTTLAAGAVPSASFRYAMLRIAASRDDWNPSKSVVHPGGALGSEVDGAGGAGEAEHGVPPRPPSAPRGVQRQRAIQRLREQQRAAGSRALLPLSLGPGTLEDWAEGEADTPIRISLRRAAAAHAGAGQGDAVESSALGSREPSAWLVPEGFAFEV